MDDHFHTPGKSRDARPMVFLVALLAGGACGVMVPMTRSLSSHSSRKRALRSGTGQLNGVAQADYSVPITLGGDQTFNLIIDTGSSTMALPASADAGCLPFFQPRTGACDGGYHNNSYGDGSWFTGRVCHDIPVSIGGLSAGMPKFLGIVASGNGFFSNCDISKATNNEGILGLAYKGLIPDVPYRPLFDSVVSHSAGTPGQVADVFSMQCCGASIGPDGVPVGSGVLVLGEPIDGSQPADAVSGLFTGEVMYTPIVEETYFCVNMNAVSAGVNSNIDEPNYYYSYGSEYGEKGLQRCPTIIDSGTSAIQLVPKLYAAAIKPIIAVRGDGPRTAQGLPYPPAVCGRRHARAAALPP